MKRVRGPRSEPRLVSLEVVEVGGLSGKGRSYLHRKGGLHTELWTIIDVRQCFNIPELCNLSD